MRMTLLSRDREEGSRTTRDGLWIAPLAGQTGGPGKGRTGALATASHASPFAAMKSPSCQVCVKCCLNFSMGT